jgi:hypothetical protein
VDGFRGENQIVMKLGSGAATRTALFHEEIGKEFLFDFWGDRRSHVKIQKDHSLFLTALS